MEKGNQFEQNVPQKDPKKKQQTQSKSKNKKLIIIIASCLVAVLVLTLGLYFGLKGKDSPDDSQNIEERFAESFADSISGVTLSADKKSLSMAVDENTSSFAFPSVSGSNYVIYTDKDCKTEATGNVKINVGENTFYLVPEGGSKDKAVKLVINRPMPTHTHVYASWETITEPTCTSTGVRKGVCSLCGLEKQETVAALGHDFSEWSVVNAGCVEIGTEEKVCSRCQEKETREIAPKGHVYNLEHASCTEDRKCTVCGSIDEVRSGHDYQVVNTILRSCTTDATTIYKCSHCNDEISEITAQKTGHTSDGNWVEIDRQIVPGTTCQFNITSTSTCTVCHQPIEKVETDTIHTFAMSIGTEATCSAPGEKILTCTNCGEVETESYTDPNAHDWDEGVTNAGVTTFTCHTCHATKSTLSYTDQQSADVDPELLKSTGSIDLEEARISFGDEAKGAIGDTSVNISATSDTAENLNLTGVSADTKVYSLTMTSDGTDVHELGGDVEVRVPYTLSEGENPDNIAILYIDSNGEITPMPATYSGGYAFFTTNHFSYYSVTLLSNEERCALYGHVSYERTVPKTCTTDGYIYKVCRRCGATEIEVTDAMKATGHTWGTETVTPVTCTTNGCTSKTCTVCGTIVASYTPALNHNWVKDATNSTEASCSQPGREEYRCTNPGCGETYFRLIPQLNHDDVTVVTPVTCTTDGYTTYTCQICHRSYVGNRVAATGHVWDIEEPTCGRGQVCLKCGAAGLPATENHILKDGVCTVCGKGCTHNFTTQVVAPTCQDKGYTLYTCSICGISEKRDFVAANGIHTYVNGKCSVCGKFEPSENGFYLNFIKSFFDQPLYLHINAGYGEEDYYSSYGDYYYNTGVIVKDIELTVKLNDNLKFNGSAKGNLMPHGSTGRYMDFTGTVIDNIVYAKFDYDGEREGVIQVDIELLINELLESNYGIEDGYNLIVEVYDKFKTNVLPTIENLADRYGSEINTVIDTVLGTIFTATSEGSGKLVFADADKITDFALSLFDKDIKTFYEEYFGEDSYEDLRQIAIGVFDWTAGEVLDKVEESGYTLDEIIDLAFDVFEWLQSEDNEYADYLTEFLPEEFFETDPDEYLSEIMDMFPDVDYEGTTVKGFAKALLNNSTYRNYTIKQICIEFFDAPEDFAEETILQINDNWDAIGQMKIPALIISGPSVEDDEELEEELAEARDMILEYSDFLKIASLSFRTDNDGHILSGSIQVLSQNSTFWASEIPVDINMSAEFSNQNILRGDYSSLKREVESSALLPTAYAAILRDNADQAEGVYDDAGRLVGIKLLYSGEDYSNGVSGKDEYGHYYRDYITFISKLDLADVFAWMVSPDCTGNITYFFAGYGEKTEYDTRGNIYSSYSQMLSHTLYYNRTTGTYTVGTEDEVDHNWVEDTTKAVVPQRCEEWGERHYVCSRCGKTYVEYYKMEHLNIQTTYTFDQNEGIPDCENGVTVQTTCTACGKILSNRHVYDHYSSVRTVELTELTGLCSRHEIQIRQCACGKYLYDNIWGFSSRWTDNGSVYSCETCGVTITTKSEDMPIQGETCKRLVARTVEIFQNGQKKYTFSSEREETNHETDTFVELLPGSTTCEDGVSIIRKCRKCGEIVDSYTDHYHYDGIIDVIDLSSYGNVCGSKAYIYGCACGADGITDVRIVGECDFDSRFLSSFINTNGGLYSQYIYTCSVTDPHACGFRYALKYREAINGCQVTMYKQYIFGCDTNGDATSTSLTKEAVYNTYLYHGDNIVRREGTGVPFAPISCVYRKLVTETCSRCGYSKTYYSYYSNHNISNDEYRQPLSKGRTLCSDSHCLNCLYGNYYVLGSNDNELDSYSSHEICDENYYRLYRFYRGYDFTLKILYGSRESWTLDEYYYSAFEEITPDLAGRIDEPLPEEGCYRICKRTTSEGFVEYWLEDDCCYGYWYDDEQVPATCTQFGIADECYICICCGRILSSGNYSITPTGHKWVYNNESRCYVCTVCGMENAVGADGDVVLEDCTDYRLYPDAYIVGYFDHSFADFELNITLIMHDTTLPINEQQILIEDVSMSVTGLGFTGKPVYKFTEDGHYILFSRTEVLEKAAALGYTDPSAFDIRLSFVPIDSHHHLDYGITFTLNVYNFVVDGEVVNTIRDIQLDELPEPKKEGLIFFGWYTEDTFDNQIFAPYYHSKEVTLYARFITEEEYINLLDGSTMEKAIIARVNTEYQVNIVNPDDYCYFQFTPAESGYYAIYSYNNNTDTYCYLYDADRRQIDYNDDGGDGNNFYINYNLTAGQTYFIGAKCYGSDTGSYTMKIQKVD